LARWNDATHGSVPPDVFIPLAEEAGLILDLGRFVLREAIEKTKQWQQIAPEVGIAVNVSRLQLAHPSFVDDVVAALDGAGLTPSCVTLEVTESVLASDTGRVIATLDRLRAFGLRVAIDDFGTGYSSFAALSELPIDTLKIDKRFIDKLPTGPDGHGFVRAILQLADTLHLSTTAEGVELPAQRDALVDHGCTHLQGYLFSKPLTPEDATDLLETCAVTEVA
jgi:EAL domain-containing protein (putative c-di-GMP-specific phosphodiesterase class I)